MTFNKKKNKKNHKKYHEDNDMQYDSHRKQKEFKRKKRYIQERYMEEEDTGDYTK